MRKWNGGQRCGLPCNTQGLGVEALGIQGALADEQQVARSYVLRIACFLKDFRACCGIERANIDIMRLAVRRLPRKVQKVFSIRKESGVPMRCFSCGRIKLRDLNRRAAIDTDTKERTADRGGENNNALRIPRAPSAGWRITNRLGITPHSGDLPEFSSSEKGDPLAVGRPKRKGRTIGMGEFLRNEGIEVAQPQA